MAENDEPYIYEDQGYSLDYKYPDKIKQYPACQNCTKQNQFIKSINDYIISRRIYQTIYYHDGNLIVIKKIKYFNRCPKCINTERNHLYKIDGEYLICSNINADLNYTITVIPYGQELKNTDFPPVHETNKLGYIIERPTCLITPIIPINNIIGKMLILADGRGIMLFATETDEFILIDEYGKTVNYDTYPELPNTDNKKMYGNGNITIESKWHMFDRVFIVDFHNKGERTKAAIRAAEDDDI